MLSIEPVRLSSLQTLPFKFVFPVFMIGGFGSACVSMWLSPLTHPDQDSVPLVPRMLFTLLITVLCAYIYWSCVRLKKFKMDSKFLYISNYINEITVHLSMIERVTEIKWDNTHPITIHFSRPTEFGSTITFMPKSRFFGFWSSHPVVDQILQAASSSLNSPS